MKTFLATYLGSLDSNQHATWNALDEATRNARVQAGMKAWGDWMQRHQEALVYAGGPLGRTKRVDAAGVADVRNDLAGFVIVQADSHEAAARLFEQHPHFAIFPGDAVEIMECLPVPGM